MYWLLCRLSPIPGMSSHWLEVGDEVRNPSLVYGTAGYDIERSAAVEGGKATYVTEEAESGSGSDKEALPGKAI